MNDMKFGSTEWLEELKKRTRFPNVFVFIYGEHNKDKNKKTIQVVKVDTKAKDLKNIPYGSIRVPSHFHLSPYKWLIEDVYYMDTPETYLSNLKHAMEKWGVTYD